MVLVFAWTAVFVIVTVTSITLTGSRDLISGNIDSTRLLQILLDWRFIVAAIFAFVARIAFVFVNNSLLAIPSLAQASTTITAFITSVALVFVVIGNAVFLHERFTVQQGAGALLIVLGIVLMTGGGR